MKEVSWITPIEKLLNDATPKWKDVDDWYHDASMGFNIREEDCAFIAASPTNQRKLISALKVALEALEFYAPKPNNSESHVYNCPRRRPEESLSGVCVCKAQVAISEIQKIGEGLK